MYRFTDPDVLIGGNASSALGELMQSLGVSDRSAIDCGNVTDEQLETLGDAVMEDAHPGALHEAMDRMMGGEGSASLKQAHINMGRAYLGCWSGYEGNGLVLPIVGGAGYGMMGQAQLFQKGLDQPQRNMLGFIPEQKKGFAVAAHYWAAGFTTLLIWVILIELIVLLGKKLFMKK